MLHTDTLAYDKKAYLDSRLMTWSPSNTQNVSGSAYASGGAQVSEAAALRSRQMSVLSGSQLDQMSLKAGSVNLSQPE